MHTPKQQLRLLPSCHAHAHYEQPQRKICQTDFRRLAMLTRRPPSSGTPSADVTIAPTPEDALGHHTSLGGVRSPVVHRRVVYFCGLLERSQEACSICRSPNMRVADTQQAVTRRGISRGIDTVMRFCQNFPCHG